MTISETTSMTEWKEYKLGEIADVQTGPFGSQLHMSDYQNEGTPIITVEHLGDNRIIHNNLPLVGEEDKNRLKKYVLAEGDIVFSRVGSVDRRAYVSAKEDGWLFSGRCLRVRPSQKVDAKFLSYYFGLEDFKETIRRIAVGATMPSINTTILSNVVIPLPSIETQRRIASILSSLDDKIDLLHRENATLEQMAETLFRQWFVVESKEEWEEQPLKQVVDVAIGRTPPRKESKWFSTNPNDVKWLSIKDMGGDSVFLFNTSEYLTEEAVETFSIPVIPVNTVVLSFKMTVGRVGITTEKMLSNEAIAHFKFNNSTPFTKEYLYLFLKSYKYDMLGTTSSIVTSINSAMIKDMMIPIPDKKTMDSFKEQTQTVFDKIYSNQKQIQTLIQTRDGLLPRLMNNEIEI
jgi:type I restriction enzyme S subunit